MFKCINILTKAVLFLLKFNKFAIHLVPLNRKRSNLFDEIIKQNNK